VRLPDGPSRLRLSTLTERKGTPYALALVFCGIAIAAGLLGPYDLPTAANLTARWTARAALPLFLVTYVASSALRYWPGAATKALVRNRRHWGLGFALAHTIHLVALAVNIIHVQGQALEIVSGGAAAYAILYLMVLTSSNAAQRRLGRWWKRLHSVGMHYLWLVFLVAYGGRALGADSAARPEGVIASLLLIAALSLRIAVWRRARHRVASAA
jgi:methionine sulfoxide reductase heme-binding subunit